MQIQYHFRYKNKLDSFRSYQLVEADLLVCMLALGDSIKVEFDEIGKTFLYNIVTASQKSKNPTKQQVRTR